MATNIPRVNNPRDGENVATMLFLWKNNIQIYLFEVTVMAGF